MPNPRKIAVDIIFAVLKDGAYITSEMDKVRKNPDLTDTDIKFINEITRGVLKNKIFIYNRKLILTLWLFCDILLSERR